MQVKLFMIFKFKKIFIIAAGMAVLALGTVTNISASDLHKPAAKARVITGKEITYKPLMDGSVNMVKPEKQFSRQNKFLYKFFSADQKSSQTGKLVILLHGSGGDEQSLVPLARSVWPDATLLGIRGRVVQDGGTRWYKRITPVKFDQDDIKLEADAFVRFLGKLAAQEDLDLSTAVFVGYSNGANLLAASMMMHPNLVKQAVLMRSMPVLDNMPDANLSNVSVLTITGDKDKLYSPFAAELSDALKTRGAKLDARIIDAGHMLNDNDVRIINQWVNGAASKHAQKQAQKQAVKQAVKQAEIKPLPVNMVK